MGRALLIFYFLTSLGCKMKPNEIFPYTFKTITGKEATLHINKTTRGMVFIFLVPDCPFSQFYSIAVNQVYSSYFFRGFQFYGIVPGNLYALSEIDSFRTQYNFIPEILIDEPYHLTKKFKVNVVPQVIVTNTKGQILYSGKIDDQAVSPGQKKYQPTKFYLLDALKNISLGKPVKVKKTNAVGCYIE